MLQANYLVIPIDPAIASFWQNKFPDLVELFEGNDFYLTVAPDSYRPVWEVTARVEEGLTNKYLIDSPHRLEGFDINLAGECNRASVYYLLRDLEETSKAVDCGFYEGITVYDYLLPDLKDIKADLDYSKRQVTLEAETVNATMSLQRDRAIFGSRVIFQILD